MTTTTMDLLKHKQLTRTNGGQNVSDSTSTGLPKSADTEGSPLVSRGPRGGLDCRGWCYLPIIEFLLFKMEMFFTAPSVYLTGLGCQLRCGRG